MAEYVRSHRHTLPVVFATAIAVPLLLAAPAGAQEAAAVADLSLEELAATHVETVVGASKYRQHITRAPASVSIVTADEIRVHNYRSLADVLASVSGFYTSYDRNYHFVGMRGFLQNGDYNSRILLTIDGHRLNDSIFGGVLIGQEFPVDLADIDRVEVIRGPGSALYGSSALFAVINVVTRQPDASRSGQLSTVVGDQGTKGVRASLTTTAGGAAIYASVTGYHSRGVNDLFYPEFADAGGHAYGLDTTNRGNVLLNVSAGRFKGQFAAGVRRKQVPTASFDTLFADGRLRTEDTQGFGDLTYERSWGDTSIAARVAVDGYRYAGRYPYAFDSDAGTSVLNDDSATAWTLSYELRASRPLTAHHRATVGVEYRDDLDVHQRNFDQQPYTLNLDDHRSFDYWSVYVEDEWRPVPVVGVQAGARADGYAAFGLQVEPRVALILNPAPRRAIKLLYGSAFKAPTNYQRYWAQPEVTKANPTLDPESVAGAELVYEEHLNPQWRVSTTLFSYQLRDMIAQTADPVDDLLVYRNLDSASSTGVEVEVDGRSVSGYRLTVSQALQRTRDLGSDRRLSSSPVALWKVAGGVPLWWTGALLTTDIQAMTGRLAPSGDVVRGHVLVNSTLTSPIRSRHLQVAASVYNLFDAQYGDPGSREHRQSSIQQDGRTVQIKLTTGF